MARRGWRVSSGFVFLILSLLLGACARPTATGSALPATAPMRPSTSQILEAYGRVPLHFEENQGQADPSVRYLARAEGGVVGVARDGLALGLDAEAIRLTFVGAAPAPKMAALDGLPG